MARGEGFYCSEPMCDGDHPLPSMTCEDAESEDYFDGDAILDPGKVRDELDSIHHIEPPC